MVKKKDSEYTVGYGKPPKHSQFAPGQSGNPKGRPKKAKTIADAFSKLARKVITVPTKTGAKRMSMLDVVADRHFTKAANGDHRSTQIVLKALTPGETNHDNNLDNLLLEFREKNARIAEANQKAAKPSEDDDPDGTEGEYVKQETYR